MFDKVPPKNATSAPSSPAPVAPRPAAARPMTPPPAPTKMAAARTAVNPTPAPRPEPLPTAAKKTPGVEDIFSATDKAPASGKIFGTRQAARPQLPEGNAYLFGGKKINWQQLAIVAGIIVAVLVAVSFAGWVITGLLKPISIENISVGTGANVNAPATLPASPNSNANTSAGANTQTPSQPPALPADTDGDGLTDDEERTLGTNINRVDTDADGLTDRAEVKIYKTDPLNPDTDGDGFSDGQEVINGFDPLKPGSARLFDIPKE